MPDIPRRIWMFWDQGEASAPAVVRHCIASWRRHHPAWQITVLDAQSIEEFVELRLPAQKLAAIGQTKKANLLRLALLERHGGVWADATTLCCQPLDAWLPELSGSGFFAFTNSNPDRLLANWFLVSAAGNPLISALLANHYEFFSRPEIGAMSPRARKLVRRLAPVLNRSTRTTRFWLYRLTTLMIRGYPYFVFHYMFSHLVNTRQELRAIWDATPKLPARPCLAASRLGLDNRLSAETEVLLSGTTPCMYKLNWRRNHALEDPGSVLSFVIRRQLD